MSRADTRADPATLALLALGWTLGEPDRAERLLALTGLEPDELRRCAGAPPMLAAVLSFLESHEPDLVACADALEVPPDALVAARQELER
ncbi:MAG: hypothetical protein AVDCRST_MAG39-563 [uncultured Sphingomonadaceae bacterium]|uniref:DUF3572 domain-containing protein n=1 Tax=uncultured Sphingomonadaceae bacterium TaxID=169976 RepID=A0A6J4SAY3_9SPHN|nr:MAG: hypothetical protein AVDCRST_MAG39-563 [uncultured Sphingomonadaceae bacterium]